MHNTISEKIVDQEKINHKDLSGIRILVVMPSIPVQGMERANIQIMKMMRERGADVLYVVEKNHGELVRHKVEEIGCRWESASILNLFDERLHITTNLYEMVKVIRAWGKACWEIKKIYKKFKPTHIYITNLHYFLYSVPMLLRAQEPVIFRLPNPPNLNIRGWKKIINIFIWKYLVKSLCDIIICNSNYTKSQVDEIGLKNIETRVIYNCLPERINHKTNDFPVIDKSRFNIVYLGRIKPEKGVNELFQTARKIIQEYDYVDFYFAGEYKWRNPFAERLIQDVKENKLESRIHFLGEIEDVMGLLGSCNLHVCPSTSHVESLPNVILEAKSQGIPSVIFPTAGLPEAVVHLKDGLICDDKNPDSLYNSIKYFLNNRTAASIMGKNAKESLEKFSMQIAEEKWVEVYKSI